MKTKLFPSILGLALALAGATSVSAQVVTPQPAPTIITSAPYTINAPGYYQLGANLVVSNTNGNIITINSGNVILDFAGHYISGPNTPNGLNGVYAYEKGNLVIRNGTVAYCSYGVLIQGNGQSNSLNINQTVDNMLASYNFYVGLSMQNMRNSTTSNCRVSFTGRPDLANSSAYGIEMYGGTGNKIVNCTVTGTAATGSGSAYGLSGGSGFIASGNSIFDTTSGTGPAYAIYQPAFAVGNIISNAKTGIYTGIYRDNILSGCTTALTNGNDAGNNQSY